MVRQSEIAIIYMKNGLTKSLHYGKLSLVPTTSGFNTRTQANYLTMKQSQSGIGQLATIVRVIPIAILALYHTSGSTSYHTNGSLYHGGAWWSSVAERAHFRQVVE